MDTRLRGEPLTDLAEQVGARTVETNFEGAVVLNDASVVESAAVDGSATKANSMAPGLILPGGYRQIVDHLAPDLTITLGAEVTRIAHSDLGATVETAKEVFEADRVIVTVRSAYSRPTPSCSIRRCRKPSASRFSGWGSARSTRWC